MKLSKHIEHCQQMLELFGDHEVVLDAAKYPWNKYVESPMVLHSHDAEGHTYKIRFAFKGQFD